MPEWCLPQHAVQRSLSTPCSFGHTKSGCCAFCDASRFARPETHASRSTARAVNQARIRQQPYEMPPAPTPIPEVQPDSLLEIDIKRLRNSLQHLESSQVELKAALQADREAGRPQDTDIREVRRAGTPCSQRLLGHLTQQQVWIAHGQAQARAPVCTRAEAKCQRHRPQIRACATLCSARVRVRPCRLSKRTS